MLTPYSLDEARRIQGGERVIAVSGENQLILGRSYVVTEVHYLPKGRDSEKAVNVHVSLEGVLGNVPYWIVGYHKT